MIVYLLYVWNLLGPEDTNVSRSILITQPLLFSTLFLKINGKEINIQFFMNQSQIHISTKINKLLEFACISVDYLIWIVLKNKIQLNKFGDLIGFIK